MGESPLCLKEKGQLRLVNIIKLQSFGVEDAEEELIILGKSGAQHVVLENPQVFEDTHGRE